MPEIKYVKLSDPMHLKMWLILHPDYRACLSQINIPNIPVEHEADVLFVFYEEKDLSCIAYFPDPDSHISLESMATIWGYDYKCFRDDRWSLRKLINEWNASKGREEEPQARPEQG